MCGADRGDILQDTNQFNKDGRPRFGPPVWFKRLPPPPFLAELRKTLRTVVLDEADATLAPQGKGGMRNRARRNPTLVSRSPPDAASERAAFVLAFASCGCC